MGRAVLSARASILRLEEIGLTVAKSAIANDLDEVERAFDAVGTHPVVLKAAGLVHKSDDGGVVLGLESATEAVTAARSMRERLGERAFPFHLQEQVEGTELLIGVRRDPQLGAALVVGQGGVATEVHADIARGLIPIDDEGARGLLRRLRIWPLLDGYRGAPGVDIDAIAHAMVAVAGLSETDRSIVELDLNPILVGAPGAGATCVDVRIVVGDVDGGESHRRPDLGRMLRPRHVAVVGVSDDDDKAGARLFRYLDSQKFPGRLDPVHPAGGSVRGYERARSLSEVEGSPDLVCVAVPARFVRDIASECVQKSVGGVIVHSSDFAEVGESGRALQREIADVLRAGSVPLAGPNCMGIVAPHERLAASISGALEEDIIEGGVALVTSSGALGSCIATRLMGGGVGLSHWIHVGNEADIIVADYLDWLAQDPRTRTVGLLIEDMKDGPRLVEAGRRLAAAGKPAFAYNLIRSEQSREVALSHTGAMVGSVALRHEVLRAAQIYEVGSLRVLEDVLCLTAATDPPLPQGKRLMVVTFSGGACLVIAGEAQRSGIELPPLRPAIRDEVAMYLPAFAALQNPLDVSFQMLTQAGAFQSTLAALAESGDFDAMLVQFTTNADPYAEQVANATIAVREESPIPIYVSRFGSNHLAPRAMSAYQRAGVPVLDAPDRAAEAVGAILSRGNLDCE